MTHTKAILGSIALAGALLAAPHAARAQAGSVFAGYSTNADANQDHMTLTVNNLSGADFTNLTLTELLPDAVNPVTDTYNYGALAAGGSLNLDLSLMTDFGTDPAHTFPGVAPLTLTVTAQQGNTLLTTTFTQDANATGGYVQFEGIGEGASAPFQTVTPARVGVLAPVPEASSVVSLGLLLLGMGGLALRARRRA